MMTKMESPLVPICFTFQVSLNALASECMLSNLAIATSLLRERMYSNSLSADMLICCAGWRGEDKYQYSISPLFCYSLLLNLAISYLNLQCVNF